MAAKKGSTRRRRTADDARKAILDAAERRLVERGLAGIRLQDVAADVGVSHPTVLHHFKSREGLVDAVLERVLDSIYAPLLGSLRDTTLNEETLARLLDDVSTRIERGGQARVLFWLALEGSRLPEEHPLRAVALAVHELRRGAGGRRASLEDTRFAVALATLALTSGSIVGDHILQNVGAGEGAAVQRKFRLWLARLLADALGIADGARDERS